MMRLVDMPIGIVSVLKRFFQLSCNSLKNVAVGFALLRVNGLKMTIYITPACESLSMNVAEQIRKRLFAVRRRKKLFAVMRRRIVDLRTL